LIFSDNLPYSDESLLQGGLITTLIETTLPRGGAAKVEKPVFVTHSKKLIWSARVCRPAVLHTYDLLEDGLIAMDPLNAGIWDMLASGKWSETARDYLVNRLN